jgi:hypothetical protein
MPPKIPPPPPPPAELLDQDPDAPRPTVPSYYPPQGG